MRPVYIEAIDLNEAWWRCMKVLAVGREYVIQKGSFEGHKRKEFDLVTIRIECPGIRPLTPITPVGVTPPCDMEYIEGEYLNYLMSEYVAPEELYTYGQDLGYQIPKVIEMLKKTPQTNTACMSVGSKLSIDLEHSQCLQGGHAAFHRLLPLLGPLGWVPSQSGRPTTRQGAHGAGDWGR
jgi:hypothetical protein